MAKRKFYYKKESKPQKPQNVFRSCRQDGKGYV